MGYQTLLMMYKTTFLVVSVVGAIQGFMLAYLFFRRGAQKTSHFLFGIFLTEWSMALLEPFLVQSPPSLHQQLALTLVGNTALLYGPLIYLFVYYLTNGDKAFQSSHRLHFAFFFLALALDVSSLFIQSELPKADSIWDLVFWEIFVIQVLTYTIATIIRLHHFRQFTSDIFAMNRENLQWLRNILVALLAVYILSFSMAHLMLFGITELKPMFIWVQIGITVIIYTISYRILTRPQTFCWEQVVYSSNPASLDDSNQDETGPKYEKSSLTDAQADQYLQQTLAFMNKEKPYLNSEISIFQLADELNISRYHLTQILNQELGKNFYRFINEYRIKEAKELMHEPSYAHLSLSAIGLEAGFNSKTAFNTNFKKITGCTPSEWKKSTSSN